MKVKELIAILQGLDQEKQIMATDFYEEYEVTNVLDEGAYYLVI